VSKIRSLGESRLYKEGSARVEKIDRRLRPTPPPKLIKIDPMLYNPLKISDNQRSRLISDIPTRMFSGQETGNFNRQLDVLTSKEQQLESKLNELRKNNLRDEINADFGYLSKKINELENDDDITFSKYNELKIRLSEINKKIPRNEQALMNMYENLSERLDDINYALAGDDSLKVKPQGMFDRMKSFFSGNLKEVKPTNTLLDDKISKNSLVDEAEIIKDNIGIAAKSGLQYPSDSLDDDEEVTINFFDNN
jgi:chromosome segregation ATPase